MQQSTRLPPGSEGLYGPQQKQPQPPVLHTPSVSGPTTRRGNASSPLEWKQKHASLQEARDPRPSRPVSQRSQERGRGTACVSTTERVFPGYAGASQASGNDARRHKQQYRKWVSWSAGILYILHWLPKVSFPSQSPRPALISQRTVAISLDGGGGGGLTMSLGEDISPLCL